MAAIELLALDRTDWERVAEVPAAFAAERQLALGAEPDVLHSIARQTLALCDRTGVTAAPWSGFLAVDRARGLIVGTCAFNGPPALDGTVEIAYFTFPAFERLGIASAMAAELVARARSEPRVRRLRAHTLPARNASTRILEKLAFQCLGEIVDPEDGPIWRWERDPAIATPPEVWLRGPVPGIPALLQPVAHGLLQCREEMTARVSGLTPEQIWARPSGVASVGFHARHAAGSLDRLFTYARGEQLSAAQKEALAAEGDPDLAPDAGHRLVAAFAEAVERALEQLRTTSDATLLDARGVGRARLPSTVLGLLFHAAEHTQRHVGQLVTTAKVILLAGER